MTIEPHAPFSLTGRRVWLAGHRGMLGTALSHRLAREECETLTVGRETVDLRRQAEVEVWMAEAKPEAVFIAAATVGGILANDLRPAEFLYDNLMIQANILEAARKIGVAKLLMIGSSCVYPKFAPQPLHEDDLLTGPLEPTNQWYAVAKIAGIRMCQAYRRQYGCDFIAAMPTNMYGPGDNFAPESSHVVSALIIKTHQAMIDGAREVEIWGSGLPRREFLFVDDAADALIHLMKVCSQERHVNVGTGEDVSIRELAELIAEVVGYDGSWRFDPAKPDGTPRKLLDVSTLAELGWRAPTGLRDGLAQTYAWYLEAVGSDRLRA